MKKILVLLLFSSPLFGQNSKLISDVELCSQIESAFGYLMADKDLKTKNFRVFSKLGNGWNYQTYFPIEYVAYQLGVEKEMVLEIDEAKTNPIFKKLENTERKLSQLSLDCLKISRNPNTSLSKLDSNSLLINVTIHRIGKEGANGIAYLFFFENESVSKVYKTSWIE